MIYHRDPDDCPIDFGLALFKGTRQFPQSIANHIGRYLDKGPYSHAEMVYSDGLSGSSSVVDKGVRFKHIQYRSVGCWDFIPIPDPRGTIETASRRWMQSKEGCKYDYAGNVRFAFGWIYDHPDKWFCSEACMASLGVPRAFTYGPTDAAELVLWHFKTELIEIEGSPRSILHHI
jgi:hypothetical protein